MGHTAPKPQHLRAQCTTLHSCRPAQGTLTTVTCHGREDKVFQRHGSRWGLLPMLCTRAHCLGFSLERDLAPGPGPWGCWASPAGVLAQPARPPSREEEHKEQVQGGMRTGGQESIAGGCFSACASISLLGAWAKLPVPETPCLPAAAGQDGPTTRETKAEVAPAAWLVWTGEAGATVCGCLFC